MKTVAILRAYPKDATYVKIIAGLSQEYGIECFVWDRQGDFSPPITGETIHYHVFSCRAGFHNLSTFLKLLLFLCWLSVRLLRTRVDCVHAIDLDTGVVGWLVARLRGNKFVYHCVDPYYGALPPNWPALLAALARRLENSLISRADLFVITDLLRLPQHEGASPREILEFENVPVVELPAPSRVSGENHYTVGYLGSLVPGRNLQTIVQVASELACEEIHFVIGGFGPLEQEIRQLAASCANISFFPWLPYEAVLEKEGSFDLFLHVMDRSVESQRWASANKLYESMAFGRPIIVGHGTLGEMQVEKIGNGLAVDYGSVEELTNAIRYLRSHPDIARKMGEAGRNEYEARYRPQRIYAKLITAYRHTVFSGRDAGGFENEAQ